MSEVVVTGATGFVGRNLAAYLASSGIDVRPLSLRNLGWRSLLPPRSSAIIHLAGLAHDLHGRHRDEDYARINTDLTARVFDAFLGSDSRTFIYLSSIKAAADAPGERPVDEGDAPAPGTPYGRSKLAAERYILARVPEGRSVYILRPVMIHGPGGKGNLATLYRWVARGVPYPFGAFSNARSFLYVENLCYVIRRLAAGTTASGVYNVADPEPISTVDLIRMIGDAIGRRPRILEVSPGLVRAAARLGSELRLPFNEQTLGKLTSSYIVTGRKLREAIGGDLPIETREGLARTLHHLRNELSGN